MFRRIVTSLLCSLALTCSLRAVEAEKAADIVKTAASTGKFRTLLNALISADLLETLQKGDGPFTVFAPTDEAFAKLPSEAIASLLKPENKERLKAILTYHVVAGKFTATDRVIDGKFTAAELHKNPNPKTLNGEKVRFKVSGHQAFVNDAKILTKDIDCGNGVVHIIDTVLMPPEANKPDRTIVGVAREAKTFNTLLTALTVAELTEVLQGKETFTVFAPTDEAFAKLPKATLATLLKPETRETLVAILKYHVVAGKVSARDAVTAGTAKTLQGGKVKIAIKAGRLTVNDSAVIATDVTADNGVIHVIDQVLLPKGKD